MGCGVNSLACRTSRGVCQSDSRVRATISASRQGAWRNATPSTTPPSHTKLRVPSSRRGRRSASSRATARAGSHPYATESHDEVRKQQDGHGEQPVRPEAEGPGERDPFEVAEEERRVTERRQEPPDVGDQEDEEDHGVGDAGPLAVGLEDRADQEHGRAGRAEERGEDAAGRHERRVDQGRRFQVAAQADPARDHVEGRQKQDEGGVLLGRLEQRVGVAHGVEPDHREPQDARPGSLFRFDSHQCGIQSGHTAMASSIATNGTAV